MAMLKIGMAGEPVRILQTKLGVAADGDFGPATDKALKDYQKAQGIAVDGIAGPDTFAHLGLHELILLTQGSVGETVTKLQKALGIGADGQYGPATEKAVKDYQAKNGLEADGMAGPVTLAKLKVFSELTPEVVSRGGLPAGATVVPETVGGKSAPPRKSIWATVKGWLH